MWQCDNCGYTDEDGTTFEEQVTENGEDEEETSRFCPECGSDEVFEVDEDEDADDFDDSDMDEDDDDDADWDGDADDDDDDWD